jgi:hypothetical protein
MALLLIPGAAAVTPSEYATSYSYNSTTMNSAAYWVQNYTAAQNDTIVLRVAIAAFYTNQTDSVIVYVNNTLIYYWNNVKNSANQWETNKNIDFFTPIRLNRGETMTIKYGKSYGSPTAYLYSTFYLAADKYAATNGLTETDGLLVALLIVSVFGLWLNIRQTVRR